MRLLLWLCGLAPLRFLDAVLGFIGGERRNEMQEDIASAQTAANMEMAREQMTFQERMSNTAMQRQVEDLRKAGLNPIIAARGGASTPSGASAQAAGYEVTDSVASAMAGRRAGQEFKNMKAEELRTDADAWLKRTQRVQGEEQTRLTIDDQKLRQEELETQKYRTLAEKAHADILKATAKGAEIEGEIDETKYGAFIRYLNRLNPFTGTGSSAFRNFGGGR